ncbi:hypothetical protein [Streptomyces sp. NPDC085540]|uniref:hypothetical protein n=1 Tax=Streptomyces sp. NPDC085540 TaxID=3365730 RepID=UPI0037D0B615
MRAAGFSPAAHSSPRNGTYRVHKTYKRGESIPLPDSIGVSVELQVDLLLDGDEG